MTSLPSNMIRRTTSLTLAAVITATASLGISANGASAAVRYQGGGVGFHAGHAMGGVARGGYGHRGFGRGGIGHGGFARGGRGGFGGRFDGGDFGGGRVGTGLAAASLALGIFGAMASAASEQQAAAQVQCGFARQPVLRPNGTYYYRRVQVCQ